MSAAEPELFGQAFRFMVELDGMLVAGFSEVSGLQSELEYEEVAEGGVNGYTHRLPKGAKSPPIVLKRGITKSSDLWDWYFSAAGGKVKRKSGSIIMYDASWQEMIRWNFFGCYPVKWTGPELSASSSEVAVETIELVHNGLKAIYAR
ncbi:phage tail protein [Paenibacillus ehimensis]|uniref:phage tail protein n=1 Tax=Paenibacillus ehimensis TaxID=79264 RepID=UPI00047124CA|nr:phage tail protein [Paenibacillus ehimensis]MEC0213180.1 phage tail protein [Paenibacillus ehimensis]